MILNINYNVSHHMGMSQMCAGADHYFRSSKPHSRKLCYVFNLKLISFLLLGFNSIMSLNILLGYFIVLKQQLGCVRNMVALNENLGARLAVGGGVVAGADGEVHLALVRELRGVNLGQGGLLRLQTDQEELLPDTCPDYSPGSPSCCRT